MSNLTIALVFVLTLNVLMFLGQATIMDINPDFATAGVDYYNGTGYLMETIDVEDNPENALPEAEGSISPTTGNLFTDMFSSIKGWFTDIKGIRYIRGIVSAPYNMLKVMKLPPSFVVAMGTLWYGITLFLVVAFFWGRS